MYSDHTRPFQTNIEVYMHSQCLNVLKWYILIHLTPLELIQRDNLDMSFSTILTVQCCECHCWYFPGGKANCECEHTRSIEFQPRNEPTNKLILTLWVLVKCPPTFPNPDFPNPDFLKLAVIKSWGPDFYKWGVIKSRGHFKSFIHYLI